MFEQVYDHNDRVPEAGAWTPSGETPEVDLIAPEFEPGQEPGDPPEELPEITAPPDREEHGEADHAPDQAPRSTDTTDIPPPTTPPEQTGQAEVPARGEALRQVLDYTYVATGQIRDAVTEEIISTEQGIQRVQRAMKEHSATFDQAVRIVGLEGNDDEDSIIGAVTLAEEMAASVQYGHELQATGLAVQAEIADYGGDISLRLVEPEAFAAALSEIPIPEDFDAADHLATEAERILSDALRTTSAAIIIGDRPAALEACGGEAPPQSVHYRELRPGEQVSEESAHVAQSLPEQAESMVAHLRRIAAGQNLIGSVRQLAAAHREGRLTEWAVAHDMGLIGNNIPVLGVDRLTTREEWDAAYRFLDRLEQADPASNLLQEIRIQARTDIGYALADLSWDDGAARGADWIDDPDFASLQLNRQEQLKLARPLLETALARFYNL